MRRGRSHEKGKESCEGEGVMMRGRSHEKGKES